MKFGFDLHGVIDSRPKIFAAMSQALIDAGHEVHVITGLDEKRSKETLYKLEFPFTHFFSITEHHKNLGTEMRFDEDDNPFMDSYLWDRTKADYCKLIDIDIHFDDSDTYAVFFSTPYARFFTKDKRKSYGRK